jgi:hypothetical protein
MVIRLRDIAIKSQKFAHFYVLQVLNSDGPVPAMLFTQHFFYACIQLILGRQITSRNPNMPVAHMTTIYALYLRKFPEGSVDFRFQYSNALASLAAQSATTFVNSITENFEGRAIKYLINCIKSETDLTHPDAKEVACSIYDSLSKEEAHVWPNSVRRTEALTDVVNNLLTTTDFGPTPINLQSIASTPQRYMRYLFSTLQALELYNANEVVEAGQVQSRLLEGGTIAF